MIVARGLGRPSNSIAAFGLARRAQAIVALTRFVHGGGDAPRRHEDEDDDEFDYKHLVLPPVAPPVPEPGIPVSLAKRPDRSQAPVNPDRINQKSTVSTLSSAVPVLGADSTLASQAALPANNEEDELMQVFLIAMEAVD